MPPSLDWGKLGRVDPDSLPSQEKLAEKMLKSLSQVSSTDLKDESAENLVHLFRITQSLMKMKAQEVDLALEEAEKAGEEQAKIESQLRNKVRQLENEIERSQLSTGARDSRFLREEIRQLEEQLGQRERELKELRKELEKEKQVNEQLALRNEETDNENSKLRRENEQLRQDVIDYQRQIDSQRESLLQRGEGHDYKYAISKKNMELVQYLDEIQNLSEANEKLEAQNQEMTKVLEQSVKEMESMTDEYNKMKLIVQHSDSTMDQLRKEKERYALQVRELTEQIKARQEEDDPIMMVVNAKVEEWKAVLASKDEEVEEYQRMIQNLREKLNIAQMDADKSNVLALQQGLHERDNRITLLTEQLEQHTKEMESHVLVFETLKHNLQEGTTGHTEQGRIKELQFMVEHLQQKLKEAERVAKHAENDAQEKDKDLVEALRRMKEYELGTYGLEEAVTEIKQLKANIKIRDREIEALTKDINKLELKINDVLDEYEDLQERLGVEPKTLIDLTEFKSTKALKQQQYRAENQILLKEIERLEEERLQLKQQIRKLAQEKGKRAAALGLTAEDLNLTDDSHPSLNYRTQNRHITSLDKTEDIKTKYENLTKQLNDKENELERSKTVVADFKSKLKEVSEEKEQLQQGMREILQAIKDSQNDPAIRGGEATLMIPSLERLVHAIETKHAGGMFDISVHLKAQVDQLTGRNDELRQELKVSRKEATDLSNQLLKAHEKVSYLEKELKLHQSDGGNIVFKPVNLPDGLPSTSSNLINTLNEYLLHLLQEMESKEQTVLKLEDALEEYKRKFAVIRHQQGILYKEYESERESWQLELEKLKEEKTKLESQKEQDAVQIAEYTNLLQAMKLDPDEIKSLLAESSRKMTVLRVNEKSLTRRYTTLLEMEQHLRKENLKLKNEVSEMEAAVGERIGYLQRYKEIAAFKIASLQKALNESVSLSELEMANKQYNELTAKYRDMLQKDNLLVQRNSDLEHLQQENASLKSQIDVYSKELEITKEKLYTLEQAWDNISMLGGDSAMDKATRAVTSNEIISISKKITMLEMKELNERQKAEHSQKMYEHLRTTLAQVEERNFELEAKFAEITKINLEAQKVEQALRDDLANSVSKAVFEADRRRIMDLEKSEAELKVEVSKLRSLTDIAKMQVSTLMARQQSREKEVESLRKQVLDYQDQTDEKALIAKLHQLIVALQISEATAVGKLEATTTKLQKMEAYNLRLEQKLDDKEQALYYARQEGRNRAKHLRQTIQSLRRQFSGALPLAQQEKFSKTMLQLQNDKQKTVHEMELAQQKHRDAETKALELELKLKSLQELFSTLKDTRGAQKVTEWHKKMEELRLQDLRLTRELSQRKEEIKHLNNIISEQEHTIRTLEEDIVQQRKFHEERQMAWDQREVELERQLVAYEHQQNEVLSTAQRFEEVTGAIPDSNLPLPQQLEIALEKIKGHVRTIMDTKSVCRTLEEKLKDKETLLRAAEQNVLSRDKVINELRLQLPASAEQEKLLSGLNQRDEELEHRQALKVAHQTIASMQARLSQKEEVLKKYQHLLTKAREEQEEVVKKHAEDIKLLHQKLNLYSDTSLNKFRETALELMKKPSLHVSSGTNLMRLAEMEQTVTEQDKSLASLSSKLKKVTAELDWQKLITVEKVNELEASKARLEEHYILELKKMKGESEDLRSRLSQMEKEVQYLNTELDAQKEANTRAPTVTMKNLVERLKSQLTLKEKQQKALSKALLALRSEMTAHAEQQILAAAAQKEENLNVQQIVDKHCKDLKAQIEDLNEQHLKLKEALKSSKNKEKSLMEDLENLNHELRGKQKVLNKLQKDKDEVDKENEELKRRIKHLTSGLQNKSDLESKQNVVEELQKKIKALEADLSKKTGESVQKPSRDDKAAKEEIIRWEEGKKWQSKLEGMKNKLKDKDKEIESLTKQHTTLKDLYAKADQEKMLLQRKLKSRGITVDQVVGARTAESEREMEELRRKNYELENEISHMKTKQALPRDSVVEDLHMKNRYLQEKVQALEKQLSRENLSRPSSIAGDRNTNSIESESSKYRNDMFPNKKRNILRRTKGSGRILSDSDGKECEECLSHSSREQSPVIQKRDMVNTFNKEACFLDGNLSFYTSNASSVPNGKSTLTEGELLIATTKNSQIQNNFTTTKNRDGSLTTSNASFHASGEGTPAVCDVLPSASEGGTPKTGDVSFPVSTTATPGLDDASLTASTHVTDEHDTSDTGDENTNVVVLNSRKGGNRNAHEETKKQSVLIKMNTSGSSESRSDSHCVCTATAVHVVSSHASVSDVDTSRLDCSPAKEEELQMSSSCKIEFDTDHNPAFKTSGIGSDDQSTKEMELQKEILRLSSENVELQFQLEQAKKDVPRLKDQIDHLKEMCDALKKDKLEVDRKLGNIRGSGKSGKTIPELEKTIALMKRVVERVQRENDELKKAPGVVSNEKLSNLEKENERLKSDIEKLQLHAGEKLSMRYEAKTRGTEKVIAENERIRKELKTETEKSEKLRIAKRSLEVMNEKLKVNLEETISRLNLAESRGPEGTEGKAWKSVVVSRMYETKMKEFEVDLKKKNDEIGDLKKLLKDALEHEQKTRQTILQLRDEIELLKHFPEDAKTEPGLTRDFQILRLANNRLENEKAELVHQLEVCRQQYGLSSPEISASGYHESLQKGRKLDKLMEEIVTLQTYVKTSDLEKQQLKEEIKKLKKELENFDPTFFEEIEDLKYNYNEEVKKNILLEERLKALAEQFGVHVDIPSG